MSQGNKVCKICNATGHSKFYCKNKPIKPIKRSPIKKTLKPKKPKKPKSHTRGWYVKKLDAVYSQYIRLKYADQDGMVKCITCNEVKHWKEMQNGHYESRGHYPTRWLDDNCHPQDYRCNCILKGNYTEYALYMVNRYGVDKLQELKQLANSGKKLSTVEIKELIEKYKNLLQPQP